MKRLKIVLGIVLAVILGIVCYKIYLNIKADYLFKTNSLYIKNYLNQYNDDKIVTCDKQIYIPPLWNIDGGHYEDVKADNPREVYRESYDIIYNYDNTDYHYKVIFGHDAYSNIRVISDSREILLNNIKYFDLDYKLIENVVKSNNCLIENISKFNNNLNIYDQFTYFLLIYVKDVDKMNFLVNELYDKVYGGYVQDRQSRLAGGDVTMPRFIFTNNIEWYNKMVKNKGVAQDFLMKYSYDCMGTAPSTEYVSIDEVIKILLGDSYNSFDSIFTVKQMNSSSELLKNINLWIVTYELEVGVDYYLNIYYK